MRQSVNMRELAFAERMADALELFQLQRMRESELFNLHRTRESELFNLHRTREHDARAKELQQWTRLLQAVFRTPEQALTSNIEAEESHTNRRFDSLGIGDDDGAVDFRRGDHGEHDDREAMGSERIIREAGSPALRAPPGLQPSVPHHWIPRQDWVTLDPLTRKHYYYLGEARRQRQRRARASDKRAAAAGQEAP